MTVRMLRDFPVAADGRNVSYFKVGEVSNLPDQIAEGLIRDGLAEDAEKPKPQPLAPKAVGSKKQYQHA